MCALALPAVPRNHLLKPPSDSRNTKAVTTKALWVCQLATGRRSPERLNSAAVLLMGPLWQINQWPFSTELTRSHAGSLVIVRAVVGVGQTEPSTADT